MSLMVEYMPVYACCDTIELPGFQGVTPLEYDCGQCGECFLNLTGGICPITACSKSLVNGPCGGTKNGKCAVNPAMDCGWESIIQRLQAQGIPYDQYCKMTNMDEAKFLEEGKEPATRQVRMGLAVSAIIKEEKLEATDEEVERPYNDLAEKYSMDVNELKKYLDAMSVRTQIIRDKAISVVVDSAKIEKKKAPKKEAEGEAAEGEEKPAKKTAAKKSAKKEEEKAE